MKALKIMVVALLVLIAGLLLVIRRLADRAAESSIPVAQVAPPAPPAPAAEPAATPTPPAEPGRPSPVRRRITKPRGSPGAPETPAAAARAPETLATAPAAPAAAPPPEESRAPAPPPGPRRVTIAAGTPIVIRTQNTLSTERNLKGDTFAATLDEPVVANGFVIAEKGAEVEGAIVRSDKAGRVEGVSDLAIELVRLRTSDGQKLAIATELHEVHGERSRGSDAKKIGAATGIGAIIGAIAGGGKGAAIGAGVGAGAGGGTVLATRGKPTTIPSESRLVFHFRMPLEVTERR